jgi:pantoate--beta-alanine ligase
MKSYKTILGLQKSIDKAKKSGHKIAFIPTMGALHSGHLSLVKVAQNYADTVIVSIFVNPSQFNDLEDLKKYPKTLSADKQMLQSIGCDLLFVPEVDEIYPKQWHSELNFDLKDKDKVMEGEFRPGHFKGMLEVVKRLIDITQPNILIMGQKDFQQFSLVAHMINALQLPLKLIIGPTLREIDGLAMSSRNVRLTPEMRQIAPAIYKTLNKAKTMLGLESIDHIVTTCKVELDKLGLQTEYFEIVDGNTLKPIENPSNHDYIVACIATWAGKVRLIDNLILKGELQMN